MNAQQWDCVVDWMHRVEELLEQISKNTTPEEIEEPKNKITGFSAGENK